MSQESIFRQSVSAVRYLCQTQTWCRRLICPGSGHIHGHSYILPGWKWLGFKRNPRWYGRGAIALVHLVPDFSPNTVVEMMGSGQSIIGAGIGGVGELLGNAGVKVGFDRTDKREWPEVECAGHFYCIRLEELFDAVVNVIENQEEWKRKVRKRWEEAINIERVCDKYEKFLDSVISSLQRKYL